jgi:hypothetical protein
VLCDIENEVLLFGVEWKQAVVWLVHAKTKEKRNKFKAQITNWSESSLFKKNNLTQ